MSKKVFVLGIDGVPYSFLAKKFKKGKMQNLAKISSLYNAQKMSSVYPTISSVAWTTYMTGVNPGQHNIFGFIDRNPNPLQMIINTGSNRKNETIFEKLSKDGKKVISLNVPMTYPPFEVNGILVSGFLCPDISKVAYPKHISEYLKARDYCIDVDANLVKESKHKFMKSLHLALENRFVIAMDFIEDRPWDFFQLHIMETDRLFHFFFYSDDEKDEFAQDFDLFFRTLDDYIDKILKMLPIGCKVIILSDHGFCGIKKEVQINTWLEKKGLLKFSSDTDKNLNNFHPDTVCYSLLPGRIFINLEGREQHGTVTQYDETRNKIKTQLLSFFNPENGEKIIEKVFFREEIYSGQYLERAADIIVHPVDGYDLKSKIGAENIFVSTNLNGMHTYDDAYICGINMDTESVKSIEDVRKIIEEAF